jgi:multisubunit Na+/H+ antiporter MnhB subunit
MELTFFELFDWKILVICGVGTSFIVGAINTFTPDQIRARYILPLISVIVVFLNTTFIPGAKFADWQNIIFQFLFNVSAAILFYIALGKWTVDKIMYWLKKQIETKLGKDEQ